MFADINVKEYAHRSLHIYLYVPGGTYSSVSNKCPGHFDF